MRNWVLESAPDLNLRFGDPQSLPSDFKRAILRRLVDEARTRRHLWLETDDDALVLRLLLVELVVKPVA